MIKTGPKQIWKQLDLYHFVQIIMKFKQIVWKGNEFDK